MNFRVCIVWLVLGHQLCLTPTSAQTTADTAVAYTIGTTELLNLKIDLHGNNEWYEVNGDESYNDLRPNVALQTRLSVNYKFLSASIGFAPGFIPGNKDNDLKGKTQRRNFGLGLNFKHWQNQFLFGQSRGYYLKNSEDFLPNWEEGTTPFIQFPDLRVTFFRGGHTYKTNPDFSFKAVSTQTEIQLRSAGSFLPGIQYSYYDIDNSSDDPAQTSSQRSNNYEGLLTVGYIHTFVLNKAWYFSAGASAAGGITYTRLLTRLPDGDYVSDYSNGLVKGYGACGLGYNSKRLFFGLEVNAFKSFSKQNSTTVTHTRTNAFFQVFAGYRLEAPGFLQKAVAEAEAIKNGGKNK